ncbi:hypothetical protein [Streptomyces sp. TE33382]
MGEAGLIAFVWPWLGFNDAYLDDAGEPECWFGVCDPRPADPGERAYDVAEKIFQFFRLERTRRDEDDGWTTGGFRGAEIGCDLQGTWHLRRVPLSRLTSYHQIEKNIIAPLGSKFHELGKTDGQEPSQGQLMEKAVASRDLNGASPSGTTRLSPHSP